MEQSCEGLEVTFRIACLETASGDRRSVDSKKGRCSQSRLLHSELDRLRQGV